MHLGVAVAPDTNIGGTSGEEIIYIYGLPFRRDAQDLTTSGVGLTVWGGGEYQYPLGNRTRLRAGADLSRREHEGSQFDETFASIHLGPRVLLDESTEASLLGTRQPALDSNGAGPITTWADVSRWVTVSARR